jgi:hypothetical protein
MLAYVTGRVNQELLLRNEYLGAENRILRGKIKGRLLLSEGEKVTLAEIAHRLGREALENLAATANPDTMLGWYRKFIANKFDESRFRRRAGRPRINEEIERLVVMTVTRSSRQTWTSSSRLLDCGCCTRPRERQRRTPTAKGWWEAYAVSVWIS